MEQVTYPAAARIHTLCQGKEAKAVPAESIRPDRSRTTAMAHVLGNQPVLTSQFKSNIFSMRSVTANVSGGASIYARSQSHFKKRAYFKHALHYNIIYEGKF